MENITIAPSERKSLIIEMKREVKPSRRLRMHIALLASDGRSPTEISGVLFCSRTTVYAVASRFLREGRAAFDDRQPRGPRPLLGAEADERLEKLVEEDSPVEHGWLRSLELQAHLLAASEGKARLREPGECAPRAPSLGLPLAKAAPRRAGEGLRRANRREAPKARGRPANGARGGGARSFRTRRSSRPTRRWASAGCAGEGRDP